MKRVFALLTGALATLLMAGPAQAAPIPWSYDWTPSTTQLNSDTSPTSFATLTNEPGRTVNTDKTDITATNITVTSNAPPGFPDMFNNVNADKVTLSLKITDINSGLSNTFAFTGTFATMNVLDPSTISSDSANLKFTPLSPQQYVWQPVGSPNQYTINFVGYTPPGPPGSGNKGSIAYHVNVVQLDIQKVPEPSTMLLAGFGASFLGLGAWRKRRRQAQIEIA
jgi:PEP-CTERM motif